ncbi:hypothetical protein, partial [Bifidobacterium sp.]|uniref:hypothetical protein n=1 Tax=Bifidobacterium sp. TaxID=41200 RepID=UPI003D7D7BB4
NMDVLKTLLSNGWRVVRADALPGAAADPPLPPALVYILARDESAASDDDAAMERAAAAMFRLDTDWASDDPTDAEVAGRRGGQLDAMRDGYLRLARAALKAAR